MDGEKDFPADPAAGQAPPVRSIADLVFVGFNSRVGALDRYSGELVWRWKCPCGRGYTALLLDGDRLIASVQGYTYCLDPLSGRTVWSNTMEGFGIGVPAIASVNGSSPHPLLGQAADEETRRANS